jgi:ribosomal protein S18 acetylase RimI-like enzyme
VTGSEDSHPATPRAVPVVRERRASDTRVVRKIARITWRATYEGYTPAALIRGVLRRGYDRERLLLSLIDRRRDVFVVEWNSSVVGYADLVEGPPFEVELTRIYVLPEFQGSGCGLALLDRCLAAARARGARRMVLGVDVHNRRSIAWYERHGFRAAGQEMYSIAGMERPVLRMTLAIT